MNEEKLTEEEWFKKRQSEGTLYGVKWTDVKSWIDDARKKGFDVRQYFHKQRVMNAINRTLWGEAREALLKELGLE